MVFLRVGFYGAVVRLWKMPSLSGNGRLSERRHARYLYRYWSIYFTGSGGRRIFAGRRLLPWSWARFPRCSTGTPCSAERCWWAERAAALDGICTGFLSSFLQFSRCCPAGSSGRLDPTFYKVESGIVCTDLFDGRQLPSACAMTTSCVSILTS